MNETQLGTTTLPTAERPLLRYRNDDADDFFEHEVVILGTISRVDEDTVTIVKGPRMSVEVYLDDLVPLFEDDEDFTLAILTDAALHHDVVRIELKHDALAYVNPKQEERFGAPTPSRWSRSHRTTNSFPKNSIRRRARNERFIQRARFRLTRTHAARFVRPEDDTRATFGRQSPAPSYKCDARG